MTQQGNPRKHKGRRDTDDRRCSGRELGKGRQATGKRAERGIGAQRVPSRGATRARRAS